MYKVQLPRYDFLYYFSREKLFKLHIYYFIIVYYQGFLPMYYVYMDKIFVFLYNEFNSKNGLML